MSSQDISGQEEGNSLQEKTKTSEADTDECTAIEIGVIETHDSAGGNTASSDGEEDSPLILSGHENGHLYLWNTKGDLISEELLFTKHPPRPITALCSDKCGNLIITGNAEGYIRLWKLYKIQEADKEIIMMLNEELCWRAHPMKITGLFYEDNNNIVVSASEDDSIRIWHATRGAYIGHFGQEGAYKLIDPPAMTLPRDIKELPVKATSTIYDELEPSLIYDRDRDGSHRGPAEKYMGIKYYKYLTRSSSACSMQPENLEDSSKWLGKPLFPSYYRRQSNQFSMFADNMPCLVSSSSPANPDIALKTVNEKPE